MRRPSTLMASIPVAAALALGGCSKKMPTTCKTEGTALLRESLAIATGSETTPHVCVDVHAASRRDATNTDPGRDESFAVTKPDVIPWTQVTYEDAVLACGRAGKFLCSRKTLNLLGESTGGAGYYKQTVKTIYALEPTSSLADVRDQPEGANTHERESMQVVYPESLGLSYWTDEGKVFGTLSDGSSSNGTIMSTDAVPAAGFKHPLLAFRCCFDSRFEGAFERLAPDPSRVRSDLPPVPIAGDGGAGTPPDGGPRDGGPPDARPDARPPDAAPGMPGQALVIATAGDGAEAPDTGLPAAMTERTLEAWVRTTRGGAIFMYGGGGGFDTAIGIGTVMNRVAVIRGGGVSGVPQSAPVLLDDAWHHVAIVFVSEPGYLQYRIYQDGRLLHSDRRSFVTMPVGKLAIGHAVGGGDVFFGAIDEVRIWSRALTEEELVMRMRQPLTGGEPGLARYYDMNVMGAGAGVTIPDRGPMHVDATTSGSSMFSPSGAFGF